MRLQTCFFLMLNDISKSNLNDYYFVLNSESRIAGKDVRECIIYVVMAWTIYRIPGKLTRSERRIAAFWTLMTITFLQELKSISLTHTFGVGLLKCPWKGESVLVALSEDSFDIMLNVQALSSLKWLQLLLSSLVPHFFIDCLNFL